MATIFVFGCLVLKAEGNCGLVINESRIEYLSMERVRVTQELWVGCNCFGKDIDICSLIAGLRQGDFLD